MLSSLLISLKYLFYFLFILCGLSLYDLQGESGLETLLVPNVLEPDSILFVGSNMFPASSVHISKSIILIYNMAYYVYINGGRELKVHCLIPEDP